MNGFIYKITNKVNGKVYIGQTRHTVEYRWRQHLKNFNIEHRQQPLYCAFAKYGLENFEVTTLEEVDVTKLDEREIYWIAKHDSFNKGYNATIGGQGGRIYYWTDEKYEEIRTLYLSGYTSYKIGQLFNVSSTTILDILHSLGVKTSKNPLDMNAQERESFIQDYKTGVSIKELASRYNTDKETVKRFLVKHNVDLKIRSQILKDEVTKNKLIEDFLNGMPLKDLEYKYHSDSRTIKKVLVDNGYNPKAVTKSTKQHKMFLGDKDCLELIRLFCGGETKKNLAHKFNINLSTVYDILKRYNIDYYRRYNGSKSVQLLQSNQE